MTVLGEPFIDHTFETARSLYSKLCVYLKEIMQLQGIEGLLQWDQETMMPPKAAAARANQVICTSVVLASARKKTMVVFFLTILSFYSPFLLL